MQIPQIKISFASRDFNRERRYIHALNTTSQSNPELVARTEFTKGKIIHLHDRAFGNLNGGYKTLPNGTRISRYDIAMMQKAEIRRVVAEESEFLHKRLKELSQESKKEKLFGVNEDEKIYIEESLDLFEKYKKFNS